MRKHRIARIIGPAAGGMCQQLPQGDFAHAGIIGRAAVIRARDGAGTENLVG